MHFYPKLAVFGIVSIFLFHGVIHSSFAQNNPVQGTEFWLGFMENYLGDDTTGSDQMKVLITADDLPAAGTVSVPLAGWSQNFSVMANSTTGVVIPTSIAMCAFSDSVENKGVHITTDQPVTVHQWNFVEYTSDANLVLPVTALGNRYRVMTYAHATALPSWADVSISEFLIVGITDSTYVKITPKCNTDGLLHTANIPYTIMLNAGETYQVKAQMSFIYNLSGSLVEIDTALSGHCSKFAVFSGNICAFIPSDTCCCDHLCEQMMPVETWGKSYISIPLMTRKSDAIRILSSQNGTVFTVNGGAPVGLNAGETADIGYADAPLYIESNKPISVAQFCKGSQTDMSESDPFMMLLAPLDMMTSPLIFYMPQSVGINFSYYINIITTTAGASSVTFDGMNLSGSFISVPGNPAYSYAQIMITSGRHVLNSAGGLLANAYALGNYESYGYMAGTAVGNRYSSFEVITATDSIPYYFFHDTICMDTLTGFLAANDPGILDHYWDFGDGSTIIHGQSVSHTYSASGDYSLVYYYETSDCGLDSITMTLHVRPCTASSSEERTLQSFKLYPNPNNGRFSILQNASNDLIKEIQVSDILGQNVIFRTFREKNRIDVDLGSISSGIYFIRLNTNKRDYFCKFVVQ